MNLVFRCDASPILGTGHVYRCLTLATALKPYASRLVFVVMSHRDNLAQLIQSRGFDCVELNSVELSPDMLGETKWREYPQQADWQATHSELSKLQGPTDLVIVDHYSLSSNWEGLAKQTVKGVFVIDDLANRPHLCDLLLDQTLGRQVNDYSHLVPNSCQLLLGGDFTLLRQEFADFKSQSIANKKAKTKIKSLLIAMGGSDNENATLTILRSLAKFDQLNVSLLLGPLFNHLDELKAFLAAHPKLNVTLHRNVSNVAEILASQHLAIGASGASSWERMALGIPTLLYTLAPNQKQIALQLEKLKCGLDMGNIENFDSQTLHAELKRFIDDALYYQLMVDNNLSAINAFGTNKVVEKITEYCGI